MNHISQCSLYALILYCVPLLEKAKCEDLELQVLEERGQLEVATMEIATLQQKLAGLEEEHNRVTKEWCDALQVNMICL